MCSLPILRPGNTDIFYIFRVIFLASHLTWHLALNFSQSRCSINIDDWRTQTVGTSLSAHPCTCPRAYWLWGRRPADRLVGDLLGLLFLGEFRKSSFCSPPSRFTPSTVTYHVESTKLGQNRSPCPFPYASCKIHSLRKCYNYISGTDVTEKRAAFKEL